MEAHSFEGNVGSAQVRRRLGRGLSALLGGNGESEGQEGPGIIPMHQPSAAPAPGADDISLDQIERSPSQPRRDFDQAAIDELADSIRRHGILQPLIVRKRENGEPGFQLIAGERRWRAAQQIGLERVPCRVIQFSDRQASEAALEENLKREDLNVLEKALAFREYLDRFGGTIEDLARQLSMSRANVSNIMRLLELPEPVQQLVRSDRLSAGHARAILPLSSVQQVLVAEQIEKEQLSVRRVEELVRELLNQPEAAAEDVAAAEPAAVAPPELSNHVLSLQTALRDVLGAKIEIRLKKNDIGQIVIHFRGNDDFERLVGRLRKAS